MFALTLERLLLLLPQSILSILLIILHIVPLLLLQISLFIKIRPRLKIRILQTKLFFLLLLLFLLFPLLAVVNFEFLVGFHRLFEVFLQRVYLVVVLAHCLPVLCILVFGFVLSHGGQITILLFDLLIIRKTLIFLRQLFLFLHLVRLKRSQPF